MAKKFVVWHDNDYDFALWVIKNSNLSKENVIIKSVPKTNDPKLLLRKLSKEDFIILPIIKLATPDLIIQKIEKEHSKIVFASEFMTHTPQHDHVFQRFERIYCISKEKIPTMFVLPLNKTKLEKGNKNTYREVKYKPNPLAIHTYLKTSKINKTPTLPFFWPDKEGYLEYDKKHPTAPKIDKNIKRWFQVLNLSLEEINPEKILQSKYCKEQIEFLEEKFKLGENHFREVSFEEFIQKIKDFYNLERVEMIDTKNAISMLNLKEKDLNKNFMKRNKTLLFTYNSKKFRTDPYCGFVCGFSNLFCKNNEGKKVNNFILIPKGIEFSKVSKIKTSRGACFEDFQEDLDKCPIHSLKDIEKNSEKVKGHLKKCVYSKSKQQRIFGTIPDVIVFEDFIYNNQNG